MIETFRDIQLKLNLCVTYRVKHAKTDFGTQKTSAAHCNEAAFKLERDKATKGHYNSLVTHGKKNIPTKVIQLVFKTYQRESNAPPGGRGVRIHKKTSVLGN